MIKKTRFAANGTEIRMAWQPGIEMLARKVGRRGHSVRVEIIDINVRSGKGHWVGRVVALNETASRTHFAIRD